MSREVATTQFDERVAQLTAHRVITNEEHDALNGKQAGFCAVCAIPWPCEIAKADPQPALDAGGEADILDDPRVDKEIRRWQEAIRDKLIDLGAPDWKIDGAGCDSGDPLDFTLAEVGQGAGYFVDRVDELRAAIPKLVAVLTSILQEAEFVAEAKAPFSTWVAEKCRAALAPYQTATETSPTNT